MKKELIQNAPLNEQYYVATHQSGLKIYVYEKPSFSGAYAVFGTKYGSVDNSFRTDPAADFTVVPEGIAHFLEHKLFESEDGDAFARYAKTGASANAYTSFDRTCYLFSCSDHFEDSFEILLDFVQHPYFTQATVEKEQGIIGQEISMYDDSPDWVVLLNALSCMYHHNPVRINIAGTAQTIRKIDAELLYQCYRTFYNLKNMFIVVSGNVQVDRVLALCDQYLQDSPAVSVESMPYNEPYDVVSHYREQAMPVSISQFIYALKMDTDGYLPLRTRTEIAMILAILVGQQSAFYNQLLNDGLINKSFGGSLFDGRNFATIMFSGESTDPKGVADRIKDMIVYAQTNGLDPEEFELIRRQFYGRYLMAFNSVENIGDALTDCACDGSGLFDEAAIFQSVTVEDLNHTLNECFDLNRDVLSVVKPIC